MLLHYKDVSTYNKQDFIINNFNFNNLNFDFMNFKTYFIYKYVFNYFINYILIFILISFFLVLIFQNSYLNKYLTQNYLNIFKYGYIFFILFYIYILFSKLYFKMLFINFLVSFEKFDKFFLFVNSETFLNVNFGNGGLVSDSLVCLGSVIGFICIVLSIDRDLKKLSFNVFLFNMFLFNIIILVYTNNLLIMFLAFEFLFLLTIYFALFYGYTKRLDTSVYYLFLWTLFGSFIIFFSIVYLFSITKTLCISELCKFSFSKIEQIFLLFGFFIGLGFKIPIFPFHTWLTKVHVEVSSSFSIFLSGFLVKTALYCFYVIFIIFNSKFLIKLLVVFIFLGIIDASLKMWLQLDIKKLIAYATIQEMNLLLLFIVLNDTYLNILFVVFFFLHGLLSTIMFFTVEVLQKRYKTRNICLLQEIVLFYPEFSVYIWFLILIFTGFPFSIKFLIEFVLYTLLINFLGFFSIIILFLSIFLGGIGFCKNFFLILYGIKKNKINIYALTRKEKYLYIFLYFFIFILFFLPL